MVQRNASSYGPKNNFTHNNKKTQNRFLIFLNKSDLVQSTVDLHGLRDAGVKMKPRITAAEAVAIYKLKPIKRRASGNLSTYLAVKYDITEKAVRDIWMPRTWKRVTMPFWTTQDQECFMSKHACVECKKKGVTTLVQACHKCMAPVKRGRPAKKQCCAQSPACNKRYAAVEMLFGL